VALGPFGGAYRYTDLNPSFWGVMVQIIPGLHKIRAIGRFAPIGHLMIIALLACFVMFRVQPLQVRYKRLGLLLCCALWVSVHLTEQYTPVYITGRSSTLVSPEPDEKAFFETLGQPVLSFPTKPFYGNTLSMLYFRNFPDIQQINGYSGRSTPFFDQIMDQVGPNCAQVNLARSKGVNHFVFFKYRLQGTPWVNLSDCLDKPLFESHRVVVY